MKDFLGRKIRAADWVAYQGGGNRSCEYGMILGCVEWAGEQAITITRLTVEYCCHKPKTHFRKVKLKSGTKLLVVSPPESMKLLFLSTVEGRNSTELDKAVALWLHGMQSLNWE